MEEKKVNWLTIALTAAKYIITLIIGAVGGGAAVSAM